MSDLQIGLLILGLFVVGGVIAFNWIQERQFHQRAEHGFKRPEADLLIDTRAGQRINEDLEERIDPRFEPQHEETRASGEQDAQQTKLAGIAARDDATAKTSTGYVAEIRSGEVVPAATIDTLTQALDSIGADISFLDTITTHASGCRCQNAVNGIPRSGYLFSL